MLCFLKFLTTHSHILKKKSSESINQLLTCFIGILDLRALPDYQWKKSLFRWRQLVYQLRTSAKKIIYQIAAEVCYWPKFLNCPSNIYVYVYFYIIYNYIYKSQFWIVWSFVWQLKSCSKCLLKCMPKTDMFLKRINSFSFVFRTHTSHSKNFSFQQKTSSSI